ncbi:response regulator transcription factor [Aliterella atlantica]|uniref:Chemotaxis protein CheY n=1 Tax=Aliterella atlantica CENA595 TaxID=1618023 RepID=A0A0D8ZQF5_9CYAN|nr:response regulator transcription factor [Aliterella atlantica]KJH70582.1 chemotaxis protein CheY [Aliterella atlantica CENA595]
MTLTILVADDDLGTRLAIGDYLEMYGYSVIMADDGQAALAMVEEYHPHLMVTDIVMPRMNGYELVRQVRQHPVFRLLPVIFLSAHNETEERIKGYHSGCDLYLPKPFELKELGAAIQNLLERSQALHSDYRVSLTETLRAFMQSNAIAPTNSCALSLHLTNRERQVVELLVKGLSNAEIGSQLHLSSRTVEKYVSSLLRKTETSNRAELVGFALKHRLVD